MNMKGLWNKMDIPKVPEVMKLLVSSLNSKDVWAVFTYLYIKKRATEEEIKDEFNSGMIPQLMKLAEGGLIERHLRKEKQDSEPYTYYKLTRIGELFSDFLDKLLLKPI